MPLPPLLQSFLTPSTQSKEPLLGQEARNQDMSGLMNAMQMPVSGAGPTLQSQQMQMSMPQHTQYQGPVDGNGEPTTAILSLPPLIGGMGEGVLPPIGAIQPQQGQPPSQSLPMNGAVQQMPMGAQGQGSQPQTNPYVDDRRWGGLIGGDVNHPNGLIRMSQGYENGGLAGAIGYLMSNMDKQQIK